VQEFKRGRDRRIERIITLNADDLFEQAVLALSSVPLTPLRSIAPRSDDRWRMLPEFMPREDFVRVVARASTVLRRKNDRGELIGVYHIHGFLPETMNYKRYWGDSDLMLVFTDAQYWSTSATALAFANRVMLSALSESRCVFIGLSMTDINLLRWLALRTLEWDRDVDDVQRLSQKLEQHGGEKSRPAKLFTSTMAEHVTRELSQHFWIRPRSDDPTGFLSEFLATRGIHSVEIKDWTGPHFQRLLQQCFPRTSQEERSTRWQCKECLSIKQFMRAVPLEAAGTCPRCKNTKFGPIHWSLA
jgi:hypothetical protein